jgi:hypothetical protein
VYICVYVWICVYMKWADSLYISSRVRLIDIDISVIGDKREQKRYVPGVSLHMCIYYAYIYLYEYICIYIYIYEMRSRLLWRYG